ncbi:hypothetical protein ACAG75_31800, partial [Klebsiella pneumoniae]|uniref:hypothetical protein n=1 Tax=Klebsiella pneumoniae TaxID=573 RepID=UPI00385D03D2
SCAKSSGDLPSRHCRLSLNWILERAENGFSGCAGNASRPRNKLRPRSPFSDQKNAGKGSVPAEGEMTP